MKEVLQGASEQVKAQFASLAKTGHPEVRDPVKCRSPCAGMLPNIQGEHQDSNPSKPWKMIYEIL